MAEHARDRARAGAGGSAGSARAGPAGTGRVGPAGTARVGPAGARRRVGAEAVLAVLATTALLVGLAGCDVELPDAPTVSASAEPSGTAPTATPSRPRTSGRPTSAPPVRPGDVPILDAAAVRQARSTLAALRVADIPGRDPTYERDRFGSAWSDAATGVALARNGCDTRNDILRRDARPGTLRVRAGTRNCKVTGGRWVSPYTGAVIASTAGVQIDHVVPLGRAWAAGARGWDDARRLAFANDPDNLVAADGSSNQSKGDSGPSAWRPRQPFQCAYAVRYVRATAKYGLPVSRSDGAALREMLGTCPG